MEVTDTPAAALSVFGGYDGAVQRGWGGRVCQCDGAKESGRQPWRQLVCGLTVLHMCVCFLCMLLSQSAPWEDLDDPDEEEEEEVSPLPHPPFEHFSFFSFGQFRPQVRAASGGCSFVRVCECA